MDGQEKEEFIRDLVGEERTMFFQALGDPVPGPAAELCSPSARGGCVLGGAIAGEIRLLNAEGPVVHRDADHMLVSCLLHLFLNLDRGGEEPQDFALLVAYRIRG